MTNNSPDSTKPATHSTDLVLDRVATISDIENRLPDSKEIWYGHSILTSTLFPAGRHRLRQQRQQYRRIHPRSRYR